MRGHTRRTTFYGLSHASRHQQFLSSHNDVVSPSPPKAYLKWVLLDEQFKYVPDGSGFIKVEDYSEGWQALANTAMAISKSGYLFVYLSNETNKRDVFFDNLTVQHYTGPLTEETQYYPFGLTMNGISSKAVGRLENRKKYQQYELNCDLGIDIYESYYRLYDQQLGRFLQIDPVPKYHESLYVGLGNNPISNIDPKGDNWWDVIMATVISFSDNTFLTNYRETYVAHDPADFNNALRSADRSLQVAGIATVVAGGASATGGLLLSLAGGPEVGLPTAIIGVSQMAIGSILAINATKNLAKEYNYGTPPNDGTGPQHGSQEHNEAVDKKVEEVRQDPNNENIRKNQTQHNFDEKKVSNNRPDVQWDNKKTQKHYNYEVDTKKRTSEKHKKQLPKNDPNAVNIFELLPKPTLVINSKN